MLGICGYDVIYTEEVISQYLGTCGSREPCFYWDNNQDYELSRCGTMQMGNLVAEYVYLVRDNPVIWGIREHEGKAIGIYSRCASGACIDTGMRYAGSR